MTLTPLKKSNVGPRNTLFRCHLRTLHAKKDWQCLGDPVSNQGGLKGRFPFDQKFRKFRVGERMEQTFSGISFRTFGCTSRGWPKIPENRNNRKILFHSTIPTRASFSEPGNRTTWRELLVESVCQLLEQALG